MRLQEPFVVTEVLTRIQRLLQGLKPSFWAFRTLLKPYAGTVGEPDFRSSGCYLLVILCTNIDAMLITP